VAAGRSLGRRFEAATKKNADRFDVSERGTIVDKGSGKPVTGIYGLPFRIDGHDPNAASR